MWLNAELVQLIIYRIRHAFPPVMIEFDISGIIQTIASSSSDIVNVKTSRYLSQIVFKFAIEPLVNNTDCWVESLIVFWITRDWYYLLLLFLGWVNLNLESVVSCG